MVVCGKKTGHLWRSLLGRGPRVNSVRGGHQEKRGGEGWRNRVKVSGENWVGTFGAGRGTAARRYRRDLGSGTRENLGTTGCLVEETGHACKQSCWEP